MLWKFAFLLIGWVILSYCLRHTLYRLFDVNRNSDEEFLASYYRSQEESTRRYGAISCAVGIIILLFYSYLDYFIFNQKGLALLRLLPAAGMLIYILASRSYLKKHPQYTIPSYTFILILCIINIGGLLCDGALSTSKSIGIVYSSILGSVVFWTSLALISFGASKFFNAISLVWVILYISIYVLFYSEVHYTLLIPTIAIVFICNILVSQREKINFEKYAIYKELKLSKQLLEKQKIEIETHNEKLHSSNQQLESFAYQLSHDLKAPLNTISAFSNIIKNDNDIAFEPQHHKYLNHILDSSSRMQQLIADLLDFSKLKSKDFSRSEQVDLNAVVEDAKANLIQKIDASSAVIKHKRLPVVPGQYSLMVQIFQNLLANSIKFQKSNNIPIITISSRTSDKDSLITVEDNGIGIPQTSLDKVFNSFYRSENTKNYDGTGIGLATCKAIITGFGGEIQVQSKEDMGTKFQIFIPH